VLHPWLVMASQPKLRLKVQLAPEAADSSAAAPETAVNSIAEVPRPAKPS